MSASPIARQACSHAQAIPSKRVLVTDASQLPELYSSTPCGTIYSTTPGGKSKLIFFFIYYHQRVCLFNHKLYFDSTYITIYLVKPFEFSNRNRLCFRSQAIIFFFSFCDNVVSS